MGAPIKAVFFDVGNTLLFPNWEAILVPLQKRGTMPTLAQWHAVERRTKKEFDGMMRQRGHADHSFWFTFYSHLLDELAINDDSVRNSLVAATRISANWGGLRPGTREILRRLGKSYRLAVISNADGKITELLTRNGIADCFETITDSGLIGREKPHPAIFAAALESLGVAPQESLYVGDVHSVDYAGALAAGMQAILFDVAGAYKEDGLPRVASLEELETHLAGGR
ncbi:MAG TPA: HAD family hydrolase [Terriglobales bacterium]